MDLSNVRAFKLDGYSFTYKHTITKHVTLKKDADGKLTDVGRKQAADRTINVLYKLDGVSVAEALAFGEKTTTIPKMHLNNVLKDFSDKQILEAAKETMVCRVRDLLDNRKTKLSAEQKLLRDAKKLLDTGALTPAQLLAQLDIALPDADTEAAETDAKADAEQPAPADAPQEPDAEQPEPDAEK